MIVLGRVPVDVLAGVMVELSKGVVGRGGSEDGASVYNLANPKATK